MTWVHSDMCALCELAEFHWWYSNDLEREFRKSIKLCEFISSYIRERKTWLSLSHSWKFNIEGSSPALLSYLLTILSKSTLRRVWNLSGNPITFFLLSNCSLFYKGKYKGNLKSIITTTGICEKISSSIERTPMFKEFRALLQLEMAEVSEDLNWVLVWF